MIFREQNFSNTGHFFDSARHTTTNELKLMANTLDSVPYKMSGQGCDDLNDVISAIRSFWYMQCLSSDVKKNLQGKRTSL